ncbi:MAG TPA: xanthine dehydrogenase [Myxococcales bacterium]|nr:xanthine dehydrogenase [Myxococcales bacterium]HAN31696.1 xanthine dehydrogenase [Myxococcales bacterium]
MSSIAHSAIAVTRPNRLTEALEMLAARARSDAPVRLLAGCTDVLVEANHGGLRYRDFLDLSGLRSELGGLCWAEDGSLHIGALCTYSELLNDADAQLKLPMLCDASRLVGATQIQARGTFAGNVENASPAADAAPALMALDAAVMLRSERGSRTVPLDQYYQGYRATARRSDELITSIIVPAQPGPVSEQFFRKVGTRAYQAITKVGLSARIRRDGGAISEARVVATSMAATICRVTAVEDALIGVQDLCDDTRRRIKEAQTSALTPIDDVRSQADYRNEVFHRLVMQAVAQTQS